MSWLPLSLQIRMPHATAGILDTGRAAHIMLPCFDHAHAAVEGWPLLTSESRHYRRTFLLARLRVRVPRQAHGEHGAFAVLARHGHVATHHARELARDGKPEPGPAVAACSQGIGLGEILK